MILSGLQAAAAVLVPSSGIDRRRLQWGRSAAEGLAANFHGHVIKPGGLRRTGRQIAPDARKRHPVEMGLDLHGVEP